MSTAEILEKLKQGEALNEQCYLGDLNLHLLADKDLKLNSPIIIRNAEIGILSGPLLEFNQCIKLENCRIKGLKLHGITVNNGLTVKNCVIAEGSDFSCCRIQKGNHQIEFIGNVFEDIVTFEGTQFDDAISIEQNTFKIGCDLNTIKQLQCSYPKNSSIHRNIGILSIAPEAEELHWRRLSGLNNQHYTNLKDER